VAIGSFNFNQSIGAKMTEFQKAYKAFSSLSDDWWDEQASHYQTAHGKDPCQFETNELLKHDYKNIRIVLDYFIEGAK
tara:strand:+ start:85 stop:318 length:234 start_codon:yes stop_codon:yes gene_type:complete